MQPAREMITPSPLPAMTNYVVHNSGPFYVYAPGEAIHRVDARDSAPHVWAGLLVPVTDFPQVLDRDMSGLYVAGTSPDGKKTVNRIWASHIVDLIHRPYQPRAIQVTSLDAKPLVTCHDNFSVTDNLLADFNRLICPHPVGYDEWDLPAEARRVRPPKDVSEFVSELGALAYRDRCLEEAESQCGSDQIGQSLHSAILEMREAIRAYRTYANTTLDRSEEEMEKQSKLQVGKAVYDEYDRRLMWALGRKGKKFQGPQVVVPAMPAQAVTLGADFAEVLGGAIAAAVAPLRAEIDAMKAKKPGPKPKSQDPNFGDEA